MPSRRCAKTDTNLACHDEHEHGGRIGKTSPNYHCLSAPAREGLGIKGELISMFLGQASLWRGLTSGGSAEEASEAMGTIVKRSCELRLHFPAEFPSPRITVPPIKAAGDESAIGFKLASRMLLQARFAVPSLRLRSETIQQLEPLTRRLIQVRDMTIDLCRSPHHRRVLVSGLVHDD